MHYRPGVHSLEVNCGRGLACALRSISWALDTHNRSQTIEEGSQSEQAQNALRAVPSPPDTRIRSQSGLAVDSRTPDNGHRRHLIYRPALFTRVKTMSSALGSKGTATALTFPRNEACPVMGSSWRPEMSNISP